MAILINNQVVNMPIGTRVFGPANIPAGAEKIKASLNRCTTATPANWPLVSTTFAMNVQLRIDGGEWSSQSFGSHGGIQTGFIGGPKEGVEEPVASYEIEVPPGTTREVIAIVTVAGGNLPSQFSLSTTP